MEYRGCTRVCTSMQLQMRICFPLSLLPTRIDPTWDLQTTRHQPRPAEQLSPLQSIIPLLQHNPPQPLSLPNNNQNGQSLLPPLQTPRSLLRSRPHPPPGETILRPRRWTSRTSFRSIICWPDIRRGRRRRRRGDTRWRYERCANECGHGCAGGFFLPAMEASE